MTFFNGKRGDWHFQAKAPIYDKVKGHTGEDYLMSENTELFSPCNGVVLKYRNQTEMGNCLYIQEPNGNIHVFAHLNAAKVKEGESIVLNQLIALSGHTGTRNGSVAHLHYEIIAPHPESGLEIMTRELSPYKGWNVPPEEFLQNIKPELTDLEWCQTHLPEADWASIPLNLTTAFRALAKRTEWRK